MTSGDEAVEGAANPEQAQQLEAEKSRVQQLIDEYFKLDYESTVGGMPCRCALSSSALRNGS